MSKSVRRLMMLLVAMAVIVCCSATAFAYTAVEDDGDRSKATDDTSMHIVYSNIGMVRINDAGTYVLPKEDGSYDVTITTNANANKYPKLALIEKDATAEEKDAAAVKATSITEMGLNKNGKMTYSSVFTFNIPAADMGKRIPFAIQRTVAGSETPEWYCQDSSGNQLYLTVVAKPLAITNNVNMFKPASAVLGENDVVYLTMGSDSMDAVYVGYAADAAEAEADELITIDSNKTFAIPVEKKTQVVAFRSKNNGNFYNRTMTVDEEAGTLLFDPTTLAVDVIDGMTEEEAIAKASELTSPLHVDELIAAIQVQVRDENTDKYCAVAKAFWDALSDEEKEEVDDPDYFGLDTGDASKDNPLNQDEIGENELLVVSFGTSFNGSRVATIGAIEKALAEAYPEYSVRRAFTAQIIINHVQARDGEKIDNMQQALDRAVANGVKNLVVQPTHLMHGAEYDELVEALAPYKDKMTITVSEPLLSTQEDKDTVAEALIADTLAKANYQTIDAAKEDGAAIVYMGHGTAHEANVTYTQMQETINKLGYTNVFVGTVEGNPPATALPVIFKAVKDAGFKKVILRPMMVVAGDHANNDMAGDWADAFAEGGEVEVEGQDEPVDLGEGFGEENVKCQIMGLGEIAAVQQIYVEHTGAVVGTPETELTIKNNVKMFKVNKAVVTKDGTLSLTMGSDSFDKVFVGYAADATAEASIAVGEGNTFEIPMTEAMTQKPFVLAFHSVKNDSYYNRTATIDMENKTITFDPTELSVDEIDNMTTEEAIAKADVSATPELVSKLIEAIQIQVRTDSTDKYCAVAKAYWDALSDEEKEEVDDPDYFGLDTGDASKDDPLNADKIGENELLVVSFGTSFNDSRVATIGAIEKALAAAYPQYSVRRAFTAQIIINHIQARDGEKIDNMQQALDRAVANGVKNLVVQPTHLMHGAEYDELVAALAPYKDKMTITVSEPLLNTDADKTAVAEALIADTLAKANYQTIDAAKEDGTAIVYMGHGTSHEANVTYTEMQNVIKGLGYSNVFVGTVEGKPAETALPAVFQAVKDAKYTKVILRPMMVVAGDHANNDMAGDWADAFAEGGEVEVEGQDEPVNLGEGFGKENVKCQIMGLGEIAAVQQIYVEHAGNVINQKEDVKVGKSKVTKIAVAKKKATVTYKKVAGANGYEIRYSLKKNMKGAKTAKVTKGKTTKKVIKKLKKGKRYYFQVRAYKTVNGEKVYGNWSAKKRSKKIK